MNFASPGFINEMIEYIFLIFKHNNSNSKEESPGGSFGSSTRSHDYSFAGGVSQGGEPVTKENVASPNQHNVLALAKTSNQDSVHDVQLRSADWARKLEAATQRRTQVLAPENLENLWSKGRNYNKKSGRHLTSGHLEKHEKKGSGLTNSKLIYLSSSNTQDLNKGPSFEGGCLANEQNVNAKRNRTLLKRSNSSPALENQLFTDKLVTSKADASVGSEDLDNTSLGNSMEEPSGMSASHLVLQSEGSLHVPNLKCRVVGAYFEKIGSKSFAVYSIAVKDADSTTWFVKRRYRNFERLHRHLKDIPNYTLHLPPKRFLSSSIDDHFVHQRCVLLDKYLQNLLSIANVAEQHEVWDFLSSSSKNYSFGKSTSVMKTLAVNVDDAMDDIVRQFKGVSDGLLRKVSGSSSLPYAIPPTMEKNLALSWNEEETSKLSPSHSNMGTSQSLSDNEGVKDGPHDEVLSGWHSDNELNSKGFPPRVVKRHKESRDLSFDRSQLPGEFERLSFGRLAADTYLSSDLLDDPVGMPPEWTPPNVSVPILNLVDKVFQLNRRGWLRRQVFWISKQILQLMMEDAIDDWLLRQIQLLRRDDVIAQGIRWVQDILWPNGSFFIKLEFKSKVDGNESTQTPTSIANRIGGDKVPRPGSFEAKLEAARRASDVKKMLLGGAPTALVSLIGYKQYRRCAKDIYFFLQSTICVKQLAYCMLELLLISVFPELRDLVQDIHDKVQVQMA